MLLAALALGLLVLVAPPASGAEASSASTVTLALPRPLRSGETAWIEVQVGLIGRGQEIVVTTASGRQLGTISPFGLRAGQEAGGFTLPLPPDAIGDGRVAIRLSISQYGAPPRAPTPQEVRGVRLKLTGEER